MSTNKVEEAQAILQTAGLPPRQQNEIAALTLLVLAQLSEDTPWSQAQRKSLGIHDMLVEIKDRYGKDYAENTRETVRRQVIHQFMQAGIVVKNPDNPALPTNSPLTHYALTEAFLGVIQAYGTSDWVDAVQSFLEEQVALIERYQRERTMHRVPLQLPTGEQYTLSPGTHNELQAQIINKFGPTFAPGSSVLYVGDTENKIVHLEGDLLKTLGFPVTQHDKLPDIVLYDAERNRLYLIEAVTSHGPVSHKRLMELETLLTNCGAKRIYVSAFPSFKEFGRHIRQIAWDTEVWLALNPEHLIHFNGDKFFSAH
jgi:type II restriction enzyme